VTTQSRAPAYQVQALWPQPFDNQSWVLGSVTGVTVDAQNHVWVVHRGAESLENNEKGMMLTPPTSSVCCMAAPFVLEFDAAGKLVSSWGGPGQGYEWPQTPGGLTVDAKGMSGLPRLASRRRPLRPREDEAMLLLARPRHPWRVAADRPHPPAPRDAHVLKFGRDGKFLMQIGAPGRFEGAR
jgi:hypothetical protein